MKRFLFLQVCILVCTLISADPIEINGIFYELYGNRAKVSHGIYAGDLIIPSQVAYDSKIYIVTKIGTHAFDGSYELTSLTLPNTIDTIEHQAFQNMSLDTLVIPSSVKYIGTNVLGNLGRKYNDGMIIQYPLSKLVLNCDSVVLENWLWGNVLGGVIYDPTTFEPRQIECEVVWNVRKCKLTEVAHIFNYGGEYVSKFVIGDNVDSIPSYLIWNNGSMPVETLVIGQNVRKIGQGAFSGCNQVKNLYWNARYIESSEESLAFGTVSNLIIGGNVGFLPEGFFQNNKLLTSINIPESVVDIAANAFRNCSNVTHITSHSYIPAWIDPTSFEGISTEQDSIPIYIPSCALENYQTKGWQNVGILTEPPTDYVLVLSSNNNGYGYVKTNQRYSSCNSVTIFEAIPYDGYRFKEWNDGVTTNPRTVIMGKDETFIAIFEAIPDALVETFESSNISKYIWDGSLIIKKNKNCYDAHGNVLK